jgi:hypothetical protein
MWYTILFSVKYAAFILVKPLYRSATPRHATATAAEVIEVLLPDVDVAL